MNKKAFTLIEMLVVVAIIGILAAVALTSLGPSRDKAKDTRIISAVNQARVIAEGFYNPVNNSYEGLQTSFNDTNGKFKETKDEISRNGGTLELVSQTSSYALYSNLASESNKYYCVDNKGNAAVISNKPSASNPVCK